MENIQTVWLVGKLMDEPAPWEIVGVFATEQDAVNACDEELMFIGPLELGKKTPKETTQWPGAYYPLCEEKPNRVQETVA